MTARLSYSLLAVAALSVGMTACRNRSKSDAAAMAMTPMVRLERGACFGRCPQYGVDLFENGAVRFDGRKNVDSLGAHQATIKAKAVSALQKEFVSAAFATADSVYEMGSPGCGQYVTDGPQMVMSAMIGTSMHTVRLDTGCTGAPRFLKSLAARVDSVARTRVWINTNGESAR